MKTLMTLALLLISIGASAQTQSVFTNKKSGLTVEYEYFNHTWNGETVRLAYIRLYEYDITGTKTFRAETQNAALNAAQDEMLSKVRAYSNLTLREGTQSSQFKYTVQLSYGELKPVEFDGIR